MPALASKLSPRSEDFKTNAAAMQLLVDDLNAKLSKVALGGGVAPRVKHVARGKLLPRDRVEMLLDPDTPFLEIAPLAAHGMYNGDAPGAGLIAGIGRVAGVECMVVCNDATVKGGTYLPDDGQEAPPLPGGGAGRTGCRASTSSTAGGAFLPNAGRSLPRPRPLRADLLQPGPDERQQGIAADRRRAHGLVHRRWRVRAGDERRGGDRA